MTLAIEQEVISPVNIHLPAEMIDKDFVIHSVVMDTDESIGGDIDWIISRIQKEFGYEYIEVKQKENTKFISLQCSHNPPPPYPICVGSFSYLDWDCVEIIAGPLSLPGRNKMKEMNETAIEPTKLEYYIDKLNTPTSQDIVAINLTVEQKAAFCKARDCGVNTLSAVELDYIYGGIAKIAEQIMPRMNEV